MRKFVVLVLIMVVVAHSPSLSAQLIGDGNQPKDNHETECVSGHAVVRCVGVDPSGAIIHTKQQMSSDDALMLLSLLSSYQQALAENHVEVAEHRQQQLWDHARAGGLLTAENHEALQRYVRQSVRSYISPRYPGRGVSLFCNYASTGSGSALPVLIFPRLVPILLMPIPRVFYKWQAFDAVTSCGGMLSGRGFIASGVQSGIALGFWGIGFSVFLPPLTAYGIIGYALMVTVSATDIEYWPPTTPQTAFLKGINMITLEQSVHMEELKL